MLITPDMTGGSYLSSINPIERAGLGRSTIVVTLARIQERSKNLKVVGFAKYFDYRKYGQMMAKHSIVSAAYHYPLFILTFFSFILYRPAVVISNGLVSGLCGIFLASLFRRKFVLMHNGQLEYYVNSSTIKLLKNIISPLVSFAVVNSSGSKRDLSALISDEKILIIESPVAQLFFESRDREKLRNELDVDQQFVIFYAGWFNSEKRCDRLLELALSLKDDDKIVFWFAGDGQFKKNIIEVSAKTKNIIYLGYIGDKDRLAELFTAADIVWGIGDTSYLARTAIEGLACGTPIIVPDIPGVEEKARRGIRISRDFISSDIGFIVDDTDKIALRKLILDLSQGELSRNSVACRKYAEAHNQSEGYEELNRQLIEAVRT